MENKHTLLWVGLLGIGGVFAYEWWKKKQHATATTTPQGGSSYILPTTMTSLPATVQPSTPNNPATSTNQLSQQVVAVVQDWAHQDGRAPVMTMAAAMVPAEYNGMYDIITNFWNKAVKVQPGSTQEQFWDNLRNKYDPSHVSW